MNEAISILHASQSGASMDCILGIKCLATVKGSGVESASPWNFVSNSYACMHGGLNRARRCRQPHESTNINIILMLLGVPAIPDAATMPNTWHPSW